MTQKALAGEMLKFVEAIPASAGLEWTKNYQFLYYFEAERLLRMREVLLASGVDAQSELRVLDFGYLHGLVPEFLGRTFPHAQFTVLDHPQSPNFTNQEYLAIIRQRSNLRLEKCDIADLESHQGTYDLVVLGEIVEHLDPTKAAQAFQQARRLTPPQGRLLITSPNAAGLKNSVFTLLGEDAQHPPLPDPTMGYGHIHLWSVPLLKRTLEHFGWRHEQTRFTHGFEKWALAKANRHWGSLKHQLAIRLLYQLAELYPPWRGYYVSLWRNGDPDNR